MRNLASYDVDIACLSETRSPKSGSRVIKVAMDDKEYRLYHSGPTDNSGLGGVAIAMNQVASNTLLSWEPISPRIVVAIFAGKPFNLTLIAVYAPTVPSATADKDAFYYQLQDFVSRIPRKYTVMLAGDWNAQVGQPDEETRYLIGRFSLGQRCANGERLLNFSENNRLSISSTKFQHPKRHSITWYSNDGFTAHHIDHFLVRSRWYSLYKTIEPFAGPILAIDVGRITSPL